MKHESQATDVLIVACPPPALLARRLRNGRLRYDEHGALEKLCTGCNEYWPADSEFFYASSSVADGLGARCKACYLENRYPNGRSSQKTATEERNGNEIVCTADPDSADT